MGRVCHCSPSRVVSLAPLRKPHCRLGSHRLVGVIMSSRPAGVSAEDVGSAVRVHLDRVHDAVRRLGCEPEAALEVVEVSAVDLVEAIAHRPATVSDAVGWWFRRALELGRQLATRKADDLPLGGGALSADTDQQVLAQALDQLPERERIALLLRDSYDLPVTTVGAALDLDASFATALVSRARVAFLPLFGEQVEPADAQQRTRTLLSGLTVAAVPEPERSAVMARLDGVVFGILASSAALPLPLPGEVEYMDDEDEPRLFSPLLVLLALVLVAVGGLGLGLVLGLGADNTPTPISPAGQLDALVSPPPVEPEVLISPPVVEVPAPATSVFVIPSPSPSPIPPPPPPPPPPPRLSIAIEPSSGGNGAELQVTGLGWPPGATVTVTYLDTSSRDTGSRVSVVVDDAGEFSVELLAEDPADLPGLHTVVASDGARTVQVPYIVEP